MNHKGLSSLCAATWLEHLRLQGRQRVAHSTRFGQEGLCEGCAGLEQQQPGPVV